MEQIERIKRARKHLLLDKPFYGFQLVKYPLIEDNSIKTASTNGKWIRFNPQFIKTLTNKQIQTVLVHEARHINELHHLRRQGRDCQLWNEACDHNINSSLIYNEGFEKIDIMLLDSQYTGMSPEQIYSKIRRHNEQNKRNTGTGQGSNEEKQNKESGDTASSTGDSRQVSNKDKQNGNKGTEYVGIGDIEDAPAGTNINEEANRIKEQIIQAAQFAERAGNLPDYIKRYVTEKLKPKIQWEQLLANWIDELSNQDYTWMIRDSRITDYYFPSLNEKELGTICIVVDVSGSINQLLYNQFISEIKKLRHVYNFDCYLLAHNTGIVYEKYFTKYQTLSFDIKGGGGTRFAPVFERTKNKNIVGMIYFTDMESPDLNSLSRPRFEVLWIDYGRRNLKHPFGRKIKMEV